MSQIHPTRADFNFFHPQQLRWGDVDRLGHVNNVQFFRFFESARTAYIEDLLGDDLWQQDEGLILADTQCSFLQQLHYPGTVDVGVRVVKIGNSSFEQQYGLFLGDNLIALGRGIIVWFNMKLQKSQRIPDLVREKMLGK